MKTVNAKALPLTFRDIASARQRVLRQRFSNALTTGCAVLKKAPSRRATLRLCRQLAKRFDDLGADGTLWAVSRMLRYRNFGPEPTSIILNAVCALKPREAGPFFKRLHRSLGRLQGRDDPHSEFTFVHLLQQYEAFLHRNSVPGPTVELWRRAQWPKFVGILETLEMPRGGRLAAIYGGIFDSNRRKH